MHTPERADIEAICPLDGRYRDVTQPLVAYFSEGALIRFRLHVEVEWLIEQCGHVAFPDAPLLDDTETSALRALVTGFDNRAAARVKEIERRTRHDVKAVEQFLGERVTQLGRQDLQPRVHLGCTSEDINNLAYGLLLREGLQDVWLPAARRLVNPVTIQAERTKGVPLLARTHGQPASPTTVGKELAVYVTRWERQLKRVANVELLGKFNGASGTFGAHLAAYPEAPWEEISRRFVQRLGLVWSPLTTQIEPHDYIAELTQGIARFNTVLADFCTDMWAYVGAGCFKQRVVASEVGSSTMPHKVNPIQFENAEANAGISSAVLDHLARKLPVSRLQRDLTDSSALRNLGVGFGHSLVAIRSATAGVERVEVDEAALRDQLDGSWEVLAEAIQTMLRRHGDADGYERLKRATRGSAVSSEDFAQLVAGLDLPDPDRQRLLELTPAGYTGLAAELVDAHLPAVRRLEA